MNSKAPYKCIGGPFDGGTIHLSTDGDRQTMVFTAGGQCGRYVGDKPVPNRSYKAARNESALPIQWVSSSKASQ